MIEKYPSIARLNEAIAGPRRLGSSGTVEGYIKGISKFLDFLKINDPEIAISRIKSGEIKPGDSADLFIDHLLKTYSHHTARNYVFGVKKWYDLNGIQVNWKKIEMPTASETVEEDRAPTKEELKQILNHASSARDRFAIFALTSSGLRIGTLLTLRVGDVDLNYPDVARLTVERKRGRKFTSKRGRGSGKVFMTWITPEAKKAFQQYLKERKYSSETVAPESPLIGDYNHKGNFISVEAFEKIWARLLRKADLADKSQSWYKLHLHTLRKYFRSNCIGVDASYRERWMGHKGLYLDTSYFKAEENLHLAEYRKAVPYLTIYAIPTEEKKLKTEMLLNFAKLQGYEDDQLKRLEDILARARNMDEAISEFRRLKDENANGNGNGKHIIAKSEPELLQRLNEGWNLVQNLNGDKFLLQRS
jgi:integrase